MQSLTRRLIRETSGVAMIEFAWTMPILLACGSYGIECANLAMTNLRISQIALNLADNASRVGASSTLSTQQLREFDVNDVLRAAQLQGASIGLTTRGRIIMSSLENVQQTYDTAPTQRVHWQRCLGMKGLLPTEANYNSSYGATAISAGTDDTLANAGLAKPAPAGMGDAGSEVNAPAGSGVIFVEINYQTKPLFGSMFISPKRLHYVASFIVRDRRDFSQLFNPVTTPATPRSTCNLYTS